MCDDASVKSVVFNLKTMHSRSNFTKRSQTFGPNYIQYSDLDFEFGLQVIQDNLLRQLCKSKKSKQKNYLVPQNEVRVAWHIVVPCLFPCCSLCLHQTSNSKNMHGTVQQSFFYTKVYFIYI